MIQRQDFGVVQTFILLSAVVYVLVNLLIDVLYGLIDPRVRDAGRTGGDVSERGDVVLDVRGVRTEFATRGAVARAVRGVDFTLRRGRKLAIVGESGCGKSASRRCAATSAGCRAAPPGRAPPSCWARSTCPTPRAASTTTRTSTRAGCDSGW